jgi:transcriptional regulator with XRE-family HTH domain
MHESVARWRAMRAYADFSQPELAERLGVSHATARRREGTDSVPSPDELLAVAKVCGVPAWFALHGWDGLPQGQAHAQAHALLQVLLHEAAISGLRLRLVVE